MKINNLLSNQHHSTQLFSQKGNWSSWPEDLGSKTSNGCPKFPSGQQGMEEGSEILDRIYKWKQIILINNKL